MIRKYKCKQYKDVDNNCRSLMSCPVDEYNMFKDMHLEVHLRRPCMKGAIELDWVECLVFKHILEKEFIEL